MVSPLRRFCCCCGVYHEVLGGGLDISSSFSAMQDTPILLNCWRCYSFECVGSCDVSGPMGFGSG